MKNGPPHSAVMAPTGSSDGAMTVRSVPLIDRLRDLIDSPNPA